MKVLYIGVYKDGTGWAHAAQDYILALDNVGVDVVPRAVKLNQATPEIPEKLLELEKKSSRGCDIVIQHLLPHHMDYNGYFKKCIALYHTETSHFRTSSWSNCINRMDEAWVSSNSCRLCSANSGIHIPTRIISYPINISKFQQSYQHLSLRNKLVDPNSFIFYFIGERSRRKNIAGLVKVFHTTFDPSEPVELVIKATLAGDNPVAVKQNVEDFCNKTKAALRLYRNLSTYKKEIIIVDDYSEVDIMRLHSTCDCFVMPSCGESICIPVLEAMAMGKTPIVTDQTGMIDYINNDVGTIVPSQSDIVFGLESPFNDLFTGRETWRAINLPSLGAAMREAYDNKNLRQQKSLAGIEHAYNYSYEVIGNKLKDTLCRDISY